MADFMCVLRGGNDMSKLSKEAKGAHMQAWGQYMQELSKAGHYKGGAPFKATGATVSTDGVVKEPVGKGKRQVSGYMLLEAKTIAQATKLAKACPILEMGGTVEVRAVAAM